MQAPPAPADEAGKTLARCLVEIEHLRKTCRSIEEVQIVEAKLKTANDLLAAYRSEIALLSDEAQADIVESKALIARYEARAKAYEAQLKANQTEVMQLRRESVHLRKGRNVAIGIMIGLGVGLAWALSAR